MPEGYQPHHEAIKLRLHELYSNGKLPMQFLVGDGEPAEAILRTADQVEASLIVIGTHGRRGLKRLLAGSVAEAVLRPSRCPVLTIRSPIDDPTPDPTKKPRRKSKTSHDPADAAQPISPTAQDVAAASPVLEHA